MSKIGYKLSVSFVDVGVKEDICFNIKFPRVYKSRKEAEKNKRNVYAKMVKYENETIILLYECEKLVDCIKWQEWWKYECLRLKDKKKGCVCIDGRCDYEPYSAKFEDIFDELCREDEKDSWYTMKFWAYEIEPVEVYKVDIADKEIVKDSLKTGDYQKKIKDCLVKQSQENKEITLLDFLSCICEKSWVTVVHNLSHNDVYTAIELLEKERQFLDCKVQSVETRIGKAGEEVALDSTERDSSFQENSDISYMVIWI